MLKNPKNFQKLFKKNSLYMKATHDDGLWKVRKHSGQFWLVGWVLWHINLCWLFNAKSIFMQIVQFQIIQFF